MPLRLGRRTFADDEFVVMAIVNRTPDSFYDKGATFDQSAALEAADRAVADGADIVDIGGVRAAPGPEVDTAEEIDRVVRTVAAIRERHPDLVISVDTWRAPVGAAAVAAGADLINDAWGGADPELAEVAASTGAGLVCCHAGHLPPRSWPYRVEYADVVADIRDTVVGLAERAVSLGARPDGILIDPAHDFGKNPYHSLAATRRLDELVATGWPVLVAVSNKTFIGDTLGADTYDRAVGTLATLSVSAWLGARMFRVHDVRAAREALNMVASIQGTRPLTAARRGLV